MDGVEDIGEYWIIGLVIETSLILILLPAGIGPGSPPEAPLVMVILLCAAFTVHVISSVGP